MKATELLQILKSQIEREGDFDVIPMDDDGNEYVITSLYYTGPLNKEALMEISFNPKVTLTTIRTDSPFEE